MKKLLFVFIFCICNFLCYSEVISWKGMEFGTEENPVWLEEYLTSKNEKKLRKKFSIKKSESVYIGIGTSKFLEDARQNSQIQIYEKYFSGTNGQPQIISSLDFVYEFWTKDSDNLYTVYSVFKRN